MPRSTHDSRFNEDDIGHTRSMLAEQATMLADEIRKLFPYDNRPTSWRSYGNEILLAHSDVRHIMVPVSQRAENALHFLGIEPEPSDDWLEARFPHPPITYRYPTFRYTDLTLQGLAHLTPRLQKIADELRETGTLS